MDMDLEKIYADLMSKTADIDEKLDSVTDSKAAGKTALINKYVEESKDSWAPLLAKFQEQLSAAPDNLMIGFFYGLQRGMTTAFSKTASEKVDAVVATLPEAKPLISAEEIAPLQAVRSELFKKIKAVIDLAKVYLTDVNWEMPKKRTGSKGPRGKRALSYYKFFVGEKEYDSLKDVIADYSANYDKVSELTAAIKEVGEAADPKWNLTTPPYKWEFTLPDGNILVGQDTRPEGEDNGDEEEEEVEETEDSEEE